MDTSLQERLQARTGPIRQAKRGPVYNHPMMWYAKPDGEIVKLQGDPSNRAYYEDKGYTLLRAAEVREWEKDIRPGVLDGQRRTASLIEAIRRILAQNPGVRAVADFDIMSVDELEEYLDTVGKATGQPVKIIQGRIREAAESNEREDSADAALGSGEELLGKIERASKSVKER